MTPTSRAPAPEGFTDLVNRIRISDADHHYLASCARLRGVSVQGLVRGMLRIIARDQLVTSIVDEEVLREVADKRKGVGAGRPPMSENNVPPKDELFDSVKSVRVPAIRTVVQARAQRPNAQTISFRKAAPKTRDELRRELEQAAANTAALPVPAE